MKQITLPVVDVQPYDIFDVYLSQRTGAWLLYRSRRIPGRPDRTSLLVATYGDRRTAMRDRNALRTAAERMRTSQEYDEKRRVWSALDTATMEVQIA